MANRHETEAKRPQITVSRVLHTSKATVFQAWSSAERVKRWFAPDGYTVPDTKVVPRAGGAFEVCMRAPDGREHWMRGRFTEFDPPNRLAWESVVDGADGEPVFSAVTHVVFEHDAAGGTRVTVTQIYTVHDDAALPMIEGAPIGWNQTLDRLEQDIRRVPDDIDCHRSATHDSFTLDRLYDAAPDKVWQALTDMAAKAEWFGAEAGGMEVLERHMDVRVGGREVLKARWAGGLVTHFDAVYLDVVPERRLVYAYQMFLDARKISVSLATFTLTADGGKTKLVMTEQGVFLDGYDDADARRHGSSALLDALGRSLTR